MTQKTQPMKALKADLTPSSTEHIARVLFGGLMLLGGLGVILGKLVIAKSADFTTTDAILALGLAGGGAGVVFTKTIVELLKAIPFPWRRNGAS